MSRQKWNPWSTAPKDGRWIFALAKDWRTAVRIQWAGMHGCWQEMRGVYHPDHDTFLGWIESPEPPDVSEPISERPMPCPFCGWQLILYGGSADPVICSGCNARGPAPEMLAQHVPSSPQERDGVKAWNCRTPPCQTTTSDLDRVRDEYAREMDMLTKANLALEQECERLKEVVVDIGDQRDWWKLKLCELKREIGRPPGILEDSMHQKDGLLDRMRDVASGARR